MVLNLAYLTEEAARNFTFNKDTYKAAVKGKLATE